MKYRLFAAVEVTRVVLTGPLLNHDECSSDISGVSATRVFSPDSGWEIHGFPFGFRGPADILTCSEGVAHFECKPTFESPINVRAADGPTGSLERLPAICITEIDCDRWPCGEPGPHVAQKCGDADANGTFTATDALIVLRVAVGISECALTTCDPLREGAVTPADALKVLAAAVGLDVVLECAAACLNDSN